MKTYPVPLASVSSEDTIKKSRFITLLALTPDVEAAHAFIRSVKLAHPGAAHHCSAFIAGAPWDSQVLGFSDDGEPSGTAGKPMLAQLQGSGIGEITAVVVRYFGGIELGTGGLVKAYGQGVQQALKQLRLQVRVPMSHFVLEVDYPLLADITHLVTRYEGTILKQAFGEQVSMTFCLPSVRVEEVARELSNLSKGSLQLKACDPED